MYNSCTVYIGPADHVISCFINLVGGRRTKIWLPKSLQAEIGTCWSAVKLRPILGI